MAVETGSILCNPTEKVWTLNLSCCYFNVILMGFFVFVCVCASSSLLQVHLCPLYPFLLFHLSSWFLPPEQPMLHFSWIILSIPVLGSGWLLIASPPPSISLASFGFNTFFFFKEEAAACAVQFYPLIPLTLPTKTLSSVCSSPLPVSCSAALRISCYTEGFGVDVTANTTPCPACQ